MNLTPVLQFASLFRYANTSIVSIDRFLLISNTCGYFDIPTDNKTFGCCHFGVYVVFLSDRGCCYSDLETGTKITTYYDIILCCDSYIRQTESDCQEPAKMQFDIICSIIFILFYSITPFIVLRTKIVEGSKSIQRNKRIVDIWLMGLMHCPTMEENQ